MSQAVSDASAISGANELSGRQTPAGTPVRRLLQHYVGVLENAGALATPDLRRAILIQIHDLVALPGRAARDAEAAKTHCARAARLQAIKADAIENLGREDLLIATVAARHRLPVRYVQRLFEEDGITFTAFVLNARLARAYQLLGDLRHANLKVSVIAMEAGFRNLSYFNQSFRRRYGVAPSDVRAARAA
jgi:AraC-like DNA-binding protein